MPPYTQYTPFSPYENVLSNFRFCNSPFFFAEQLFLLSSTILLMIFIRRDFFLLINDQKGYSFFVKYTCNLIFV